MGIFDEMARRYDTPQRALVADAIADALRARLGGSGGNMLAVDYGCGTGLVGLQLAGCFKTLLLVDASPQMVEVVVGKIERAGISNAQALCADLSVSIPPGFSAGVIFMAQVLLHIPDTEHILRQLYSVLNPGGRLLIADFDKNEAVPSDKVHNGFVQADLAALLRQIGFCAVASETFYHGKNIFMNLDASLFLLDAAKPGAKTGS